MSELSRREISLKVISELGIRSPTRLNGSTDNWMCQCPFHEDNHPSMGIDLNRGIYHCFSCGRKGKMESLYKDFTGIDLFPKNGKMDAFTKFSRPTFEYQYHVPKRKTVYLNYDPNSFVPALSSDRCIDYLKRRGINLELAEKAGFLYAEDTSINTTKFNDRLCIPVYERKRLVSMEGRRLNLDGLGPKVLYPKNTSVDLLYDIDNLNLDCDVFAVEGLMDLFVLRSCSFFSNSTSIFGANVTKRQLEQISKCKRFIYIYDLDDAGKKTVEQLRNSGLDNLYILRIPSSYKGVALKDVGDFPKAGLSVEDLLNRKWLNHIIKL